MVHLPPVSITHTAHQYTQQRQTITTNTINPLSHSTIEQLEEIVKLAALPLPERPDGIVAVAKFTSAASADCRATEAEYERLARAHPATIFLRCFAEYDQAARLWGHAQVTVVPTFDLFYRGHRVARVEGSQALMEVEELLERYEFQNSQLDLFSEHAVEPWGDEDLSSTPTSSDGGEGRSSRRRRRRRGGGRGDFTTTPRTTARFIPGYDWNTDRGFFDTIADKAQQDFESAYENWLPNTEDE